MSLKLFMMTMVVCEGINQPIFNLVYHTNESIKCLKSTSDYFYSTFVKQFALR